MNTCRFCTEADLFGWRQAIFTSTCVQCEDRALAGIKQTAPPTATAEPAESTTGNQKLEKNACGS